MKKQGKKSKRTWSAKLNIGPSAASQAKYAGETKVEEGNAESSESMEERRRMIETIAHMGAVFVQER